MEGEFVWDDASVILENPAIRSLSEGISSYGKGIIGQRPLTNFSFAVDYALWGLNPIGYHLTNLLLNAVNGVLLFFLIRRFFKKDLLAFVSSLIFITHPVHTEAVAALLGRSELLMAFFYLSGFLFYLKSTSSEGWKKRILYLLFVISAIFSALSKETGITLPLMIAFYEIVILYDWNLKRWNKERLRLYIMPVIISILSLLVTLFYFRYIDNIKHYGGGSPAKTFLLMPLILKEYLALLSFPLKLCAWYSNPIGREKTLTIAFAVILLLIIATLAIWKRKKEVSFGIGWFLVTFIPLSNIIPIPGSVMAERWLYVPSIGFAIILGSVLSPLLNSCKGPWLRNLTVAGISMIILFYGIKTWTRSGIWKNEELLFGNTVVCCPDSSMVRINFADTFLKRGDFITARRECLEALRLDPNYTDAHNLLGKIYYLQGKPDDAETQFRLSLWVEPKNKEAHNNLGIVLLDKGEISKAIDEFSESIRIHSFNGEAFNGLGEAYYQLRDYARAIEYYQRSIEIDPSNTLRYWNMALALEKVKRKEEAAFYWKRYIEMSKDAKDLNIAREKLRLLGEGK